MNKKIIASTIVSLALIGLSVAPAFALEASSTTSGAGMHTANVAAKIACVGTAVNVREASLGTAMTAYTSAMNAAYNARATALTAAYTQTTMAGLRTARAAAWSTFNTSARTARKAWQSARDSAWKTYRTAAAACKAPGGTSDGANSDLEASGN